MQSKFHLQILFIFVLDLKKYTDYKMRVTASTTVGESALSEDNDIFIRTLEDGKYIVFILIL